MSHMPQNHTVRRLARHGSRNIVDPVTQQRLHDESAPKQQRREKRNRKEKRKETWRRGSASKSGTAAWPVGAQIPQEVQEGN